MSGWTRTATALGAGLLLGVVAACPSAEQVCNAATCPGGCCTQAGSCVTGTEQFSCGRAGMACLACDALSLCSGGQCTPLGGDPCSKCPGHCINGQCHKPDVEFFGNCSPLNCPGCCAGEICLSGTSVSNCGRDGAPCMFCGVDGGCQTTVGRPGGQCHAGDPWVFGTPCSTVDDCDQVPDGGAMCKLTTSSGGASYTGGYCTRLCGTDGGPCGPLSTCVNGSAGGEEDPICAPRCDPTDDGSCRTPGYACYDLGTGTGACWISPYPDPG